MDILPRTLRSRLELAFNRRTILFWLRHGPSCTRLSKRQTERSNKNLPFQSCKMFDGWLEKVNELVRDGRKVHLIGTAGQFA